MINDYSCFVNCSQLYTRRSMKWHTAMQIESQMSHCKKVMIQIQQNPNSLIANLSILRNPFLVRTSGGASGCASSKKSDTRILSKKLKIACTYIHIHCIVYNMINPNNFQRSHQKCNLPFLSVKGLKIRHLHFITPQSFLLCKRKALI